MGLMGVALFDSLCAFSVQKTNTCRMASYEKKNTVKLDNVKEILLFVVENVLRFLLFAKSLFFLMYNIGAISRASNPHF